MKPTKTMPQGKRIAIGLIGGGCLLTAAFLFLVVGYDNVHPFWLGLLVRLGIVLATICLAWPNLDKLADRLPHVILGILLVVLAVIVIRPRLLPFVLGFFVIVLVVHFGFRMIGRGTRNP